MLQRSKWETLAASSSSQGTKERGASGDSVGGDNDEQQHQQQHPRREIFHWVVSEPARDFYERLGIADDNEDERTAASGSDNDRIVIHCGIACARSKVLRLLAREYSCQSERKGDRDGNGGAVAASLRGILRFEGTVRFDQPCEE